ncbi:unnamed protein product [Penicillium salamii]|nr:unnamed protein product [Penicillium salamii]CAG8899344.1 unnamed protein product [Penicillium salamii]
MSIGALILRHQCQQPAAPAPPPRRQHPFECPIGVQPYFLTN